jgi:hypothetical protein
MPPLHFPIDTANYVRFTSIITMRRASGFRGRWRIAMTEEITLDQQTVTHIKAVSDAGQAFAKAIDEGRLSDDEDAPNYAGNYMFMGYQGVTGKALFKHIDTRQYLD